MNALFSLYSWITEYAFAGRSLLIVRSILIIACSALCNSTNLDFSQPFLIVSALSLGLDSSVQC